MDTLDAIEDHRVDNYRYKYLNNCQIFNNSGLGVYHMNIRSLNKNFKEFICLFETIKSNVHILVLSETGFNPEEKDFIYEIDGFRSFFSGRVGNKCGGVVIYVSNSVTVLSSYEATNVTSFEHISVSCNINNRQYQFIGIYRSPSNRNVDIFLDELQVLLSSSNIINNNSSTNVRCIIGDINIDILNTENSQVDNYINTLAQNNFVSCINTYTRETQTSRTCLDHFFISGLDPSFIIASVIETVTTDHYSVFIKIKEEVKTKSSNSFTIEIIDYDGLNKCLSDFKWDDIFNQKDVNISVDNFVNVLKQKISEYTSFKKIHKKLKPLKPWITFGIVRSIRKKEKMVNKIKKQPHNNSLLLEFKAYKRNLNKIIKKAHDDYFINEINNTKGDPRKLWQITEEFKSNKKKKISQIEIINDPEDFNRPIECDKDKIRASNVFNKHFSTVGSRLNQVKTNTNEFDDCKFDFSHIKKFNSFDHASESEIFKYIGHMRGRSSPGPDGIQNKTLKLIASNIIKPLTKLINSSFDQGVFPNILKESIVIPLHKQGSNSDVGNYRPISLTSNIAKIFEKACKFRLENYLEQNSIIQNNQYGFRKNIGCDDAILDMTSFVYENLNKSKKILIISLDIAKAFDCVERSILITQLSNIGIKDKPLNWFKTYLDDRTQKVKVNGALGDAFKLDFGLPQGTVLSPKLFSIYTNNISLISAGKVFTFADDTLLLYVGDSWEELHIKADQDSNRIYRWLKTLSLHINTNKTSYMTVSLNSRGQPKQSKITIHACSTHYSCNCQSLKHVDSFRYLGLEIDKHFSWKNHIIKLKGKVRRLFHVFINLRTILNLNHLKSLYYAFVQSILQYGIIGWGSAYDTTLLPLQKTHNIILRIIMKNHRRYNTEKLYANFDVFNITQLYIYKILYFINKRGITNSILRAQNKTRQNGLVDFMRVQKEIVRKHFIRVTPFLINLLPTSLTEIPPLLLRRCLKTSLKSYFKSEDYNNKIIPILKRS